VRISILVACAALCAVATVSASAEKPAASERIIVPFELVGMSAEHHVIAWFGGHPDFGCVEALDYGNGRARAILTRHDGSQIDVFGYEGADTSSGREWYSGTVCFAVAPNGRDAQLSVTMPDGKALELDYVGQDKPDPHFSGLTDPGNHSADTSLPIMYRRASSVSGPDTKLTIGGAKYPVPMDKEISHPPFFVAYSAFFSEEYNSLFIRAYAERPVTTVAVTADDGAAPTYMTGTSENRVILTADAITAIRSASTEIRFDPPFPDLAQFRDGTSATLAFSVTFGDSKDAPLSGTVTVARAGNRIEVRLLPDKPDWAKTTRALRYVINLTADGGGTSSAEILR